MPRSIAAVGAVCALLTASSLTVAAPATVADVIPLTAANLRGHATLYREGWFVVTSSERAFAYARAQGVDATGAALARALRDAQAHAGGLPGALRDDAAAGLATTGKVYSAGSEFTGAIWRQSVSTAGEAWRDARDEFANASRAFVRGHLSLRERTAAERAALAAVPGRYFAKLKDDASNLGELSDAARRRFGGRIEVGWTRAFARAGEEFRRQYEKSGEAANSLQGLGPLLHGYLKSLYHGLLAPGGRAVAKGSAVLVSDGVFRPSALATVVAGRTVEAVGLTLWHAGKTGVEIIAPTVEVGLLGGLAFADAAAAPLSLGGGAVLGALNQIALTTAAPVAGVVHAAGAAAVDSASVVGLVTYDALKGGTSVVIHQARAGVVLGYNALSAIPTHLLLGVADGAVFLAWDGPRLVIAVARGQLGPGLTGDLPVGTVVNLGELRKPPGVLVDILSSDSELVGDVLRRLPCDLADPPEVPCAR